jgi:flavin-dependent dehydrogenase
MSAPITIVGGGLGGLMLGILLRRQDLPVTLWEAGQYPRHRVCGEFISGRGAPLLRQAGIFAGLDCVESRVVRFFANGRSTPGQLLREPAVSISRWNLDQRLAEMFVNCGGDLRAGSRWTGPLVQPGLVRATGRRPAQGRTRFTGIKVHAQNVQLTADLELHFGEAGYAGRARLPGGETNICGLFRSGASVTGARDDPARFFAETLGMEWTGQVSTGSFCSVAAVETAGRQWESTEEFRLGDSMAVIPPLTGNGMSLAIESAFLAAPHLSSYSTEELDWREALAAFSHDCEKSFGRRLRISSFLQKALMHARGASFFLSCLKTMPALTGVLFRLTR